MLYLSEFSDSVAEAITEAVNRLDLPTTIDIPAKLINWPWPLRTATRIYSDHWVVHTTVNNLETVIPKKDNVYSYIYVEAGRVILTQSLKIYGMASQNVRDNINDRIKFDPITLNVPEVTQLPVPPWVRAFADDAGQASIGSLYVFKTDTDQLVREFMGRF